MDKWLKAQDAELGWWRGCTNTYIEEQKQIQVYAPAMGLAFTNQDQMLYIDLEGKSVLDIGGGPTSLLLKTINGDRRKVVDPCNYPDWVRNRYEANGIAYEQIKGEDITETGWDEVWIYNTLQHVEYPQRIIENAKKAGKVIRIFEWINVATNLAHIHTLREEELNLWLGTKGRVTNINNMSGYSAILNGRKSTFTFHLLGLAHLPAKTEYSSCAYTQKIIKLSHMLMELGHTVYFYGVEGSEVRCTEFIPVITEQMWIKEFGDHNWKFSYFKENSEIADETFNISCVREINKRKSDDDILLCTMGIRHKKIAAEVGLLHCESGVGYEGIFADYKVFESYAWMHYLYGKHNIANGNWYDVVIPNYFNPNDFPFCEEKDDYYLYMGRLIYRKGIDIAAQVTKELGKKLIVAGQGTLDNPIEGLSLSQYDHIEYFGVANSEQRAQLISEAKAVFYPTYYIGPFEGVAVEAMMCGTPVITTDWGAFSETVLHGITGYRCRTFEEFVWAAKNIDTVNPKNCRDWAINNYSLERCSKMYQEYFERLYALKLSGWYESNSCRKNLDWLKVNYGSS